MFPSMVTLPATWSFAAGAEVPMPMLPPTSATADATKLPDASYFTSAFGVGNCTLVTVNVPLDVNVWMVLAPTVVIVPPVAVSNPVAYATITTPEPPLPPAPLRPPPPPPPRFAVPLAPVANDAAPPPPEPATPLPP